MNRLATATQLALMILVIASCSKPSIPSGALKIEGYLAGSPEVAVDIFKLQRLEHRQFEDGEGWIGLFTFRYKYPKALEFWGRTSGRRSFEPQYTAFRTVKNGKWQSIPVGYCETGARTDLLTPGKTYEIQIPLSDAAQPGKLLQASLDSYFATFWSEPFTIPKR